MPIKVVEPRKDQGAKNYRIRGTYLGFNVDKSAGTSSRATAQKELKKIERDIELGRYREGGPSFADAAYNYMNNGGEATYMPRLLEHFGETPIRDIDQDAIDRAAIAIYPIATPATRNRSVYTPVSAVMRRGGVKLDLRRPDGAGGNKQTAWLWPEQAEALFREAEKLNKEFGVLLVVLLYTGMRLSEALGLTWQNMRLEEGFAYVSQTKNDDPRAVFLPEVAVAAIRSLPPRERRNSNRQRVLRFHRGGHIYSLLRAAAARAEIDLPERSAFHLLRHTWASWMMRYGRLNTKQLVGTGAWKDVKSANRYAHTVTSEDASRAAMLPVVWRET